MVQSRLLITGGAGFIGSHLADAFAGKGYKVRILDNLTKPVHRGRMPLYIQRKGYEFIRGDVRSKSDWLRALKGVEYVYHFAAYQDQRPDFSSFFKVNTVSTALLYELIAANNLPVKKVVFASTQFVYGDGAYRCAHRDGIFYPEPRRIQRLEKGQWEIVCPHSLSADFVPFQENQPVNPPNAYALSKLAAEKLAMRFAKTYGIPTVALRYSIVQGPRQSPYNLYSGALRIFTTQALAGKPITVYEDGKQMRDFIHIKDAVAATFLAAQSKKANFEIINIGGGKSYRVLDFAKLVKKITKSVSPIIIGGFRRTDTRHAVSSIKKAENLLGWKPHRKPKEAIAEYVRWLKKEFPKNKQLKQL